VSGWVGGWESIVFTECGGAIRKSFTVGRWVGRWVREQVSEQMSGWVGT